MVPNRRKNIVPSAAWKALSSESNVRNRAGGTNAKVVYNKKNAKIKQITKGNMLSHVLSHRPETTSVAVLLDKHPQLP